MFSFNFEDFSFKKILEFLLSFELIFMFFLSSSFLLFLPERFIEKIYLFGIRERFGTTIGLVFLISCIIVVVKSLNITIRAIKKKYSSRKLQRGLIKGLESLNEKERATIKEVFESEENVSYLPMHSGVVVKLETFHILAKTVSNHATNMLNPTFPYSLQPWVCDYLEKNPNYFD